MKKAICFTFFGGIVIAIMLSKFMFKTELDLTGYLTFDSSDGVYVYNLSTENLTRIKVDDFNYVSNITGYAPKNDSFFCVGRTNNDHYVLNVSSSCVTDLWKLPERPLIIKAVNKIVFVALENTVCVLNCTNGNMEVLVENVAVNNIIVCENRFVLWTDESHYVGSIDGDRVVINNKSQHEGSFNVADFVDENTLLLYKPIKGQLFFYNLMTDTISKTGYDVDDLLPMVVKNDKILCLYETNYTSETRWYVYQISEDKSTPIKTNDVFCLATNMEWVS